MAMGNPPLIYLNGKNTYRNGGFSVARFDCQMETHNTDELCQVVAAKKGGTKVFPWVNGYCSHDTMISISVNSGSHFQVHSVSQVWDAQLSPAFKSITEGSLEVKLPTIWTDEKQSREEAERRGRLEERRVEEKDERRKKMQMREKVGKSRNTVFFQWFVAPEGRKVGSLKRRVRSQLARWVMKNCTPLWHEAHFEVKMYKTPHCRTTFGNCDVEKVHAVVARSKHISKWKCTKHTRCGPLLAVEMSKKCTPLWGEAHFEVKMLKTLGVRTTFGNSDVEKVHAVVAWSTFWSQNVKTTRGSDHFWKLRCRFASLH